MEGYPGVGLQSGGLAGRADRVLSVPKVEQERLRAVPDALIYQEARLQDLDAVVDRLYKQLHSVLRPTSPTDPRNEKNEPHPVGLVEAISKHSARIEFNCRVLNDLIDRLEI